MLALSCYQAIRSCVELYRWGVVGETSQLPFDWQGRGAGRPIVDPGVGSVLEVRAASALVVAGANDAVASPAIATKSAKKRTATFIFSNLMVLD